MFWRLKIYGRAKYKEHYNWDKNIAFGKNEYYKYKMKIR